MRLSNTIITGLVFAIGASIVAAPALAQSEDSGDREGEPVAFINSTPEAYAAMQELPADEPLFMLNLIRFKDEAEYGERSEFAGRGWTGEQAYSEYSRISGPIAQRVGGRVAFAGLPQLTVIGPEHEKWDVAFIVSYPDLASFLALVTDPEYKEHAFHRSAAVADSRLVRMASLTAPQ